MAGTDSEGGTLMSDVVSSRRQFLRMVALGSGAALLAACGQQAPAPAPTAAPAKPTAAPAAPVAPTSAPSSKPAEAAKPTAAPAVKAAAPSGKLTVSQNADPRSLWASSSTNIQEINYSEQ